jgi:hypothetical protein
MSTQYVDVPTTTKRFRLKESCIHGETCSEYRPEEALNTHMCPFRRGCRWEGSTAGAPGVISHLIEAHSLYVNSDKYASFSISSTKTDDKSQISGCLWVVSGCTFLITIAFRPAQRQWLVSVRQIATGIVGSGLRGDVRNGGSENTQVHLCLSSGLAPTNTRRKSVVVSPIIHEPQQRPCIQSDALITAHVDDERHLFRSRPDGTLELVISCFIAQQPHRRLESCSEVSDDEASTPVAEPEACPPMGRPGMPGPLTKRWTRVLETPLFVGVSSLSPISMSTISPQSRCVSWATALCSYEQQYGSPDESQQILTTTPVTPGKSALSKNARCMFAPHGTESNTYTSPPYLRLSQVSPTPNLHRPMHVHK